MNEIKKVPTRDQIAKEDTWATEDLFATEELWEQELATMAADQAQMASYAGRLGESAETLYQYLELTEKIIRKERLLFSYAQRKVDEDTRNAHYQAMLGRYRSAAVALGAATSFDTPEIMALSEEKLESFYAACPQLERFRRYMTDLRRRKEHTLSAQEEKLMAAAAEMAGSPSRIFGAFSDADLKYPDALDSQGRSHPLTSGSFIPLQSGTDRSLRQSAYENLYDTLASFKNTSAAILNAQNKQLKFFAEARKYDNARQAALDVTNVPISVYDNLIEAVHQNLDKMHRYVRLRKKLLGVEKLHFWDVYAPLMKDAAQYIPFAQAKETVYQAMEPLGEGYRAILRQGLDNRWIDVYENVGKRSGAYSAGADIHPFVLLNYAGTLKSQFTLAHEMGHALHSYLSHKHQSTLDANYVIFVAEVASTCNEALLMEYLLKRTTDKKQRAQLINHFLEQFKGIIFRQTMFAEFERSIGQMTAQGKTLTAEALCAEYKRLNQEYFGPDMEVDDRIAMEWARIPHFYYNYYVFQYSTGYAAAIALSRRILRGEAGAVEDYLNFLSGGCSKSPIDLLKGAGVDMTSPEPVNQALALFGELLDEMEQLAED